MAIDNRFKTVPEQDRALLMFALERAIEAYDEDIETAREHHAENIAQSYEDKKQSLEALVKRLQNAYLIGYLER